jgi:hypothetical protein
MILLRGSDPYSGFTEFRSGSFLHSTKRIKSAFERQLLYRLVKSGDSMASADPDGKSSEDLGGSGSKTPHHLPPSIFFPVKSKINISHSFQLCEFIYRFSHRFTIILPLYSFLLHLPLFSSLGSSGSSSGGRGRIFQHSKIYIQTDEDEKRLTCCVSIVCLQKKHV